MVLARACSGRRLRALAAVTLTLAVALPLVLGATAMAPARWALAAGLATLVLLLACRVLRRRGAVVFESTRPQSVESVVREGTRNYRRVRLTLYGVLAALCCNFFIQNWLARQTEESRRLENDAIELAATQRWLSQRIARLAQAPSQANGTSARELLATLAQSDMQARRLRELLQAQDLLENPAHAEVRLAWQDWSASRADMAAAVRTLAATVAQAGPLAGGVDEGVGSAVGARADVALSHVQALLDAMHATAARSHAARVRQMQLWGVLNIALLSLLALVAVEPAVRSIRRQYRRLATQAVELQRLALVAERTTNAVLLIDEQRCVAWANQAFTRITGIAPADAVGRDALSVLQPADGDIDATAHLQRSLHSAPGGGRLQIRHRAADGLEVWLDIDIQPLHDDEGATRGHVVVSVDITPFKQVQADLRIAAIAFDSLGGIAITDANEAILRVNPAFTRITGFTIDEARGRSMGELLRSGRHDQAFFEGVHATLRSARHWQGEVWSRRKGGEIYPQWLSITAVGDDAGRTTHYVAVFTDITEKKRADETIRSLAFFDPLTRLPNRRLLRERILEAIAASTRTGRHAALLFIDLDHFKELNDSKGHDVGDQLLREVATRLSAGVRSDDTVARQGGDEFVVLIAALSDNAETATSQAARLAETMRCELNRPFLLGSLRHHTSPSIGVTVFAGATHGVDELLKRADSAMYLAKHAGRNAYRFFDPALHAEREQRVELEADLHRALEREQLELHFQPQVDAQGRVTGAEALLRWNHPTRGSVPPGVFIPLAEESALIADIGTWVLETAAHQLDAWGSQGDLARLELAVNVSARQFRKAGFCDIVSGIGARIGPQIGRLKLELTESLILTDVDDVVATMHALRALGVRLALDDFGTGQSSLSYLTRLPLDQLKIDQSFVRNMTQSRPDSVVVQTIIGLAQSLGIDVIAEGVETQAQHRLLLALGCQRQQGYLFGRPLPLRDFEALVRGR